MPDWTTSTEGDNSGLTRDMIPSASWRPMLATDIAAVEAIAAIVHPKFPEDRAVFAERQRLHPAGTWVLESGGVPLGYVLSHPWRSSTVPALNSLLHALPADADTYYLHDLALLPQARGSGAASWIVRQLIRHAADCGLPTMSLVAVSGSVPFWTRHGFSLEWAGDLEEKLASYDADARWMRRSVA